MTGETNIYSKRAFQFVFNLDSPYTYIVEHSQHITGNIDKRCGHKRYRILMGQSLIENPEKLATEYTKQRQTNQQQQKPTTQYVLDTNIRKQTQKTLTRHEPSNKHN